MIARHRSLASNEILEAIDRLSKDAVPAVRYQVASRIDSLYHTAREIMWQVIDRICREELNCGVLQGLFNGPFQRICSYDTDRIVTLAKLLLERVHGVPGSDKVRQGCIGLLVALYIRHGHPQCREVVLQRVSQIPTNPSDGFHLFTNLRASLTHGSTDHPDPDADSVRSRALDLVERMLCSAHNGFQKLARRHEEVPAPQWAQSDQEVVNNLAQLLDGIGREIYFASGAFEQEKGVHTSKSLAPRSMRFYGEARKILDGLATVHFASTVHHLLQTLKFFIPFDPRGVFLRIGNVVSGGQKGGYEYESLGADLLVRIVERYLAEYRTLLQQDDQCLKVLVDTLDIFVEAGWPAAQRLSYRLDEIFR